MFKLNLIIIPLKEAIPLYDPSATFLTITQTAKKLGVRVYEYIYDRVCGKNEQPSLAELIRRHFENPASPCGP
jgi:hypothetical protein